MRVTVFGATGGICRHVVAQLTDTRYRQADIAVAVHGTKILPQLRAEIGTP